MIESAFLISLMAVPVAVVMCAFQLGTRLALLRRPSIVQSALVALVPLIVISAVTAGGWLLAKFVGLPWYVVALMLAVALPIGAVAGLWLAQYRTRRELLRGLVVLALAAGVGLAYPLLALRLTTRAYAVTANGMAPCVKGHHFHGVCTHCGGETILSARDSRGTRGRRYEPAPEGICTRCYRFDFSTPASDAVYWGDRVIALRLATPRRWDVIVFEFPEDRRQTYVQRLVGLPGETIEVRGGVVWIDGLQQTPPPDLAALAWQLPSHSLSNASFATEGQPLKLGEGEYFVLGDNSLTSFDSRFWGPVPKANMVGAAIGIYFPPRSARLLPRHP